MRPEITIGWRTGRLGKRLVWCDACSAIHGPKSKIRWCGAPDTDRIIIFGDAPPKIIAAAKTGADAREIVEELRAKLQTPPTLPAYRFRNRRGYEHLVVFCQWCRAWHLHGADPGPHLANGHRCSHCHGTDTPYHFTGYTLREVGVATREVIKDLKRRRARGVQPATGRI